MTDKQKEVIKLQLTLYKNGIIEAEDFISIIDVITEKQSETTYIPYYPWWYSSAYEQNPQMPPYQVTSTTKVE